MARDASAMAMIESAQRVLEMKGQVVLFALGEKFRVKSAELSEDGQTILCEAADDDAEITIRTSALFAVKEIVDFFE